MVRQPEAGRRKDILLMLAASLSLAWSNLGRLLVWAFPLLLYEFSVSFFLRGNPGDPGGAENERLGVGSDSGTLDSPLGGMSGGEMMAAPDLFHPVQLMSGVVSLLLSIPVQFSLQRHVLLGTRLCRPAYLLMFTSRQVWRYIALVMALTVLMAACAAAELLLWRQMLAAGAPYLLPVGILAVILGIVLMIKISLAPAIMARGDARPIHRSWTATKGGILRILGLYLLSALVLLLISVALIAPLQVLGLSVVADLAGVVVSFFGGLVMSAVPCQYLLSLEGAPTTGGEEGEPTTPGGADLRR